MDGVGKDSLLVEFLGQVLGTMFRPGEDKAQLALLFAAPVVHNFQLGLLLGLFA